jgi:hypothetical protein
MSVTWDPISADDGKIHLNMVMLSEDAAAQNRARRFQSILLREMDGECLIDCKAWLMDALSDPAALPSLTGQAANADMLVLSIHGASRPHHVFDGWLDAWSRDKTEDGHIALVLLCDRSKETWPGAVAARTRMRKIARKSGMEFFEPGNAHQSPLACMANPVNRPRLFER